MHLGRTKCDQCATRPLSDLVTDKSGALSEVAIPCLAPNCGVTRFFPATRVATWSGLLAHLVIPVRSPSFLSLTISVEPISVEVSKSLEVKAYDEIQRFVARGHLPGNFLNTLNLLEQ